MAKSDINTGNIFIERLKSLRKARHLTQVQVAEDLHISKGAVAMWETGKRTPPIKVMEQLAEYFDCRIDYLLGTSEDAVTSNREYKERLALGNSVYRATKAALDADALAKLFKFIAGLDEHGIEAVRAVATAESSRCSAQQTLKPNVEDYLTVTVSIDQNKAPFSAPAPEEFYEYAASELQAQEDAVLTPDDGQRSE